MVLLSNLQHPDVVREDGETCAGGEMSNTHQRRQDNWAEPLGGIMLFVFESTAHAQ